MNVYSHIALRYLFSKKGKNAINIISGVSTVGVAIGTAALIVILSVFNGIGELIENNASSLTPDITISPSKGKFMVIDSSELNDVRALDNIIFVEPVIEEKCLARYGEIMMPVTIKGVSNNFIASSGIDKNILLGHCIDTCNFLMGYGVASNLKIGLTESDTINLYYPDKNAVSALSSLRSLPLSINGVFSVLQEFDNKYIITPLDFASSLFKTKGMYSKIEIKTPENTDTETIKSAIHKINPTWLVKDKYDVNSTYYAMMRSEKVAVFLILIFIIFVASFNILASVSMLIIDKKQDLQSFRAMGMKRRNIASVFMKEGMFITLIGCVLGLILGCAIVFIQQKYGILKLGNGNYITDAYPVKLILSDVVLSVVCIIVIGYTASWFPVKFLIKRHYENG